MYVSFAKVDAQHPNSERAQAGVPMRQQRFRLDRLAIGREQHVRSGVHPERLDPAQQANGLG